MSVSSQSNQKRKRQSRKTASKRTASTHSKPHDTRGALVQAATKVFAAKGFSGTTVKDIADQAKVNVALISYHFDGKEGLFRSCLETFSNEKLEISSRILSAPESFADIRTKLRTWLEVVIQSHIDNEDTLSICMKEMGSDLPLINEIFAATIMRLFERLIEFFRSGQRSGFLKRDLDPFMVAAIFQGTILQFVRLEKFRAQVYGPKMSLSNEGFRKNLIDHILTIFLQGVK